MVFIRVQRIKLFLDRIHKIQYQMVVWSYQHQDNKLSHFPVMKFLAVFPSKEAVQTMLNISLKCICVFCQFTCLCLSGLRVMTWAIPFDHMATLGAGRKSRCKTVINYVADLDWVPSKVMSEPNSSPVLGFENLSRNFFS